MKRKLTSRINLWRASAFGFGLASVLGLAPDPAAAAAIPAARTDARPLADGDKKPEEPKGDPVAVDKLPKAVVDAVKKAMPGVRITKAYLLKDGNYFLDDVKVGKKEWDVTVTPEGKILKKEEMKDND